MDYFKVPENPEYIEQIRKFETSDPVHADLFNSVVEALVNNDGFIMGAISKLNMRLGDLNLVTLTQAEYDALDNYDDDTLYITT